MARPTDSVREVLSVVNDLPEEPLSRVKEEQKARRTQALSLRLSGLSYDDIAKHLSISSFKASQLVNETLERAENQSVDQMRELENSRLDRAQAAIWSSVLKGDLKAIDRFLRISQQRSKINGLEAPKKIDLSVGVKQEMQNALSELEELVIGEVVQEVEASDHDDV